MSASTEAQVPGQAVEAVRPPSPFRHYRHLTLELAISQFKLRYTQSVLGYLWSLVKPAMLFGIMYVVFDKLFHVNDNTPFYPIQLLLGIVTWTFFAECTATSMQAIASNGGLLRKAYFPRSILVIAASLTSLFTFVINLTLVFVIAVALRQIDVGLRIVAVVPLLIELYLLSLGLSLFLSALFVQYHDVGHLWEVVQQALFYGSGVMFSLTYVMQRTGVVAPASGQPAAKLHILWPLQLVASNPMTQIIEDLRHAVVTPVAPWTAAAVTSTPGGILQADSPWLVPVPFVIVLGVLAIGALTFRSRARNFAQNL
ncbi:MAG: ABC transporter permease [Candidatus Dormiibacterota bacterium]